MKLECLQKQWNEGVNEAVGYGIKEGFISRYAKSLRLV